MDKSCCSCKMFNCCTIRIKLNDYIIEATKLSKDLSKNQELYKHQANNCYGYNPEKGK